MSATDHQRPRRAWGAPAPEHADSAPRHHHRPTLRRTGTRRGVILAALREQR